MKVLALSALLGAGVLFGGCAPGAMTEAPVGGSGGWPDAERPIVIDRASRTVRFAGIVPLDARDRPMLEVLVCAPDSREHEALVMAAVRPSHIHAALIALGAEPGEPGGLFWNGDAFEMREPVGPRIGVRLAADLPEVDRPEADRPEPTGTDARRWFTTEPAQPLAIQWRFTGSSMRSGAYSADADGTIVGLVSFTTEVVGMAPAISDIDAQRGFDFVPVPDQVPPFGTRVFVELRLLD
jgi:hypothetical protein